MPLYAYHCTQCGADRDEFRRIADRHDAPPCCGGQMALRIVPTRVMTDIEPYQAVASDIATGKPPMITSRSAHRDFLKRNGLSEVGDQTHTLRPREVPLPDVGPDVKRAMDTVLGG